MKVLTTGQVAKICKVVPRTVTKWFDSGDLKGYRIPGSHDRRIPGESLLRFLERHGMPLDAARKALLVNVILVAQASPLTSQLRTAFNDARFHLAVTDTSYDAGTEATRVAPDAIVIDCDNAAVNVLGLLGSLRAHPALRGTVFVLLLPESADPIRHDVAGNTEGFRKPFDPKLLRERLLTLVGEGKGLTA